MPTDADLIEVGAALVGAGRELAGIWPGYWSEDQALILLNPGHTVLLVAPWEPGADYHPLENTALPSQLQERAYVRDSYFPGYGERSFPGVYDVEGKTVYALPPMGFGLFERISFYAHEAFHFYQRRTPGGWNRVPEDSIDGLSPIPALLDRAILDDSVFLGRVEIEQRLLRRAILVPAPDSLRILMRSYLALRYARLRQHPDVRAVERRYERREGTAEYVGCRIATAATNASPDRFTECLHENLKSPLEGSGVWGGSAAQIMRWRLYSTGAVLSFILDRLGVVGWQGAVAQGRHLDQVLAKEVGFVAERPGHTGQFLGRRR